MKQLAVVMGKSPKKTKLL